MCITLVRDLGRLDLQLDLLDVAGVADGVGGLRYYPVGAVDLRLEAAHGDRGFREKFRNADGERDLGAELLESLREMKAGKVGQVSVVTRDGRVVYSPVAKARVVSKLSQAQFAALMGVSVCTLQEWGQGRREPSGAAKTWLRVAQAHLQVLRELAA